MLPLLALLVASARAQQGASPDASGGIAIESLLMPDGTLNRDHAARGAIDLRGWRMVLGPRGEPRFVREAADATLDGAPDGGVTSTMPKSDGSGLLDAPVPGDEAWDDRFGPPGINGPVYALAMVGGDLYVGGAFTIAGNALAANLAVWNGTTWSAVGDGASGPVYVFAIDGDDMFIGGQFLSAGGASSRSVVQFNTRTRQFTPMGEGVWGGFVIRTNFPVGRVHALAVRGDTVFVGGLFYEVGPSIRSNSIARFSRSARTWSELPGLNPGGAGASGPAVYALAVIGSDLYAGGGFTGGLRRYRAGAWSAPIGGGTNDTVFAIAPAGGALYVGGQFTRAGGIDASRVARLDLSDETWSALGAGFDAPVYALAIEGDDLYAGGRFSSAGFQRAAAIARWSDGVWVPIGDGLVDSAGASVRAVLPVAGGLYAGGRFRIAGRVTAHNIGYWNGSVWRAVRRGGSENVDRNGVNGPVHAVAVRGSDVFVAGDFTVAGGVPASRIARWNGEEWSALGTGIGGADALVRALAVDSAGTVYVGGILSSAGGASASGIARWDGARWSSMAGGVGGDNPYVFALAVQGGRLIAGGAFTSAGGVAASHVAAWDIASGSWMPLGEGIGTEDSIYSYVTAIGVQADTLYFGGSFDGAGGVRAPNLVRLVGTTYSPAGVGSRTGMNAPVAAIVTRPGVVYAAGTFTLAGGDSARYVAELVGDRWRPLGAGLAAPASSLALEAGGALVVGGEFTRAGSTRVGYVARWNAGAWSTYLTGTNGPVRALAAGSLGVHAGGDFTLANGQKANNIALYDFVGWTSLGSDPASGLIGTVLAAAIDDGDVYIGGLFASAGGVRASGAAHWDGNTWRPMGAGVDGPVRSIAIAGDEVFFAGEFSSAGGVASPGIARWSRSARRWSGLGSGLEGTGPYAFALAVRGDDLYVGGSFSRAGGVDATARIARWSRSGRTWSPVGGGIAGSGYYTYVSAIALDSSGGLYAGGIFPFAGGTRVNNIARWDGAAWHPLGEGLNNAVYDIAIDGTSLYATGEFLRAGRVAVRRIARWDGTDWLKLGGDGFDRRVYSLAMHRGVLYAAGEFLTVDDEETYGVARWTGDRWLGLGSGVTNPYAFSGAYALAVDDSAIYVGGNFTVAGRRPSFYFARWVPSMQISGVETPRPVVATSRLLRAIVPNPSSYEGVVRFTLASAAHVRLELFAVDGRPLALLADERFDPGEHERSLPVSTLAPGAYLCRLSSGDVVETMLVEVIR
jgi:hypothetical protein